MRISIALLIILISGCKADQTESKPWVTLLNTYQAATPMTYFDCQLQLTEYSCPGIVIDESTDITRIRLESSGTELDSIDTNGQFQFASGCRNKLQWNFPNAPGGGITVEVLKPKTSFCGLEVKNSTVTLEQAVPTFQGGPDWQDLIELGSDNYRLKFER
ncbi:hypothetical protein EHQ27_14230 [Leptospira wolffii]|uniref:hypothetical protein n=1 Tax=Leptospira wolffii TaxID=409998 RepID=UPI0010848557|nr:hypothetical protein [Leptospira wolffii]TGK55967.1 hypothetical protein EHQ32_16215 [Leptospira wolffii]TGK68387.1 hypothetical protein EHQ27_14230 [Leptospira wolffii]TGK72013.1 hypothetical protein EHQ35_11650 [Leptospira wolffii]TGL27590.1 hypothetical protein EHQ57_14475 [Leptospira wolffii]